MAWFKVYRVYGFGLTEVKLIAIIFMISFMVDAIKELWQVFLSLRL